MILLWRVKKEKLVQKLFENGFKLQDKKIELKSKTIALKELTLKLEEFKKNTKPLSENLSLTFQPNFKNLTMKNKNINYLYKNMIQC
jgi:hypothetical protein